MRVVLDTNVILRAISPKSKLTMILDSLYEGQYEIALSTDILLEYEEKITQYYGGVVAESFLAFLLLLPTVVRVEPSFSLQLIKNDPDDDKFVDCAFASNAHFIVTDDKHFNILRKVSFPAIAVMSADVFYRGLSE